jgi:hypothetical protein
VENKGANPCFFWSTSRGAPKTSALNLLVELRVNYPLPPLVTQCNSSWKEKTPLLLPPPRITLLLPHNNSV